MKRFLKVSLLMTLISCSTSHAVSKIRRVETHRINSLPSVKLIAPTNYKNPAAESQSFISDSYELDLYARNFVRGDLIYLELTKPDKIDHLKVKVNKREIILSQRKWGYRGFFTIHPENEDPHVVIEVSYDRPGEHNRKDTFEFNLEKKEFPVSRTPLNLGKYSQPEIQAQKDVQEKIALDREEKNIVFSNIDPDHFNNVLAHPRDNHETSSGFYAKRIYDQYKFENGKKIMLEPKISYHRGFDFRAKTGDPVFAMATGKVVLARELYFEGNCVMIDHGDKVISVYMHLSHINTFKGQLVTAGHLIGRVGSTGISTGPHLHVALYVDTVPTDPMSLLPLPIRY